MNPRSDHPLSGLPRPVVPASLLATVERAGSWHLRGPAPRREKPLRQRMVDVAMTGFCVVNVIWIARIVHLLP